MTDDAPGSPSYSLDQVRRKPTLEQRIVAALEVLICSEYPTQLLLAGTFAALGFKAQSDGVLNLGFVVALSMADSALLIGLIFLFLHVHGESARDLFLGYRPVLGEVRAAVPLTFFSFVLAATVLITVRAIAPSLHNEQNPFQQIIDTPQSAAAFALVAVVAGGIREELQRAFLLHRFEQWLGGRVVGVVIASAAFGAGHLVQGIDAAIATGVLGAFWAIVYLRRRSVIAPMVSHSGFNLLQLLQFIIIRR